VLRIWDIAPGYLNRASLLGEHRELHGIASIHLHGKRGYAQHPETKRWKHHLPALYLRHVMLVQEMNLRGYAHRSPLPASMMQEIANFSPSVHQHVQYRIQYHRELPLFNWPPTIDEPGRQFQILKEKYKGKEIGRIPIPKNAQMMWAHHKYSVLARDTQLYQTFGKLSDRALDETSFFDFARELTAILYTPPGRGTLRNALEHMWGYVAREAREDEKIQSFQNEHSMLMIINNIIKRNPNKHVYLLQQTALTDLAVWIEILYNQ